MTNTEILRELGFTEGEIKVYFALFELGETTVGPISEKSRVTHAKVYPILTKLINKGLASHVIKEGRKCFSATNPNSLLEFIDTKVRSLEEEKSKIKEIIPSLLAKQSSQEQVQYSRVFEGFRGLRALFYELFSQNKEGEILVLGLENELAKPGFISFFSFYHNLRKESNINLRLILKKSAKRIIEEKYAPERLFSKKDKIKYVDVVFPTGAFIFKDHVIIIVSDEGVTAFDIKSKQNSERYKNFFEIFWNSAK
ncbi:MAG: helix-turn-helix domain-containing protein [Candidatus Woesearchaeota archaeon]